jgi:hypothetical protein
MEEIFDREKCGFHNDRVTKIAMSVFKPAEFKAKLEFRLIIANRLASLNQPLCG